MKKLDNIFKKAFSKWEANYSPDELTSGWDSIKSQIPSSHPAPQGNAGNSGSGFQGIISNVKGLLIISGAAVVTVATIAFFALNNQKPEQQSSLQKNEQEFSESIDKPNLITTLSEEKDARKQITVDTSEIDKIQDNKVNKSTEPHKSLKSNKHQSSKGNRDQSYSNDNTKSTSSTPPKEKETTSSENQKNDQEKLITDQFPQTLLLKNTNLLFDTGNYLLLAPSRICEGEKINIVYTGNANINFRITLNNQKESFINHYTSRLNKPGFYQIPVTAEYKGTEKTYLLPMYVYEKPRADFEYTIINSATVSFYSTSNNTESYLWIFNDGGTGNKPNLQHTFAEGGNYQVKLIAYSNDGCPDTMFKDIMVEGFPKPKLGNVFSPNNDGKNDQFPVMSEFQDKNISEFEITILDLQGKVIFKGHNQAWDGHNNELEPSHEGKYYYQLSYKFEGQDKPINTTGIIWLKRN